MNVKGSVKMDTTKSLTIKLYLLTRNEAVMPDEYSSCVVCGKDEKAAREVANGESGSEGYVWLDGARTEAKELGVADDDVQGVVLWSKESD